MTFSFTITKKDPRCRARTGVVKTPHGSFKTPAFVSVATAATVRALTQQDLEALGVQVALANTYHLHLRPGEETVKKLGGLHDFMNFQKPLFTDSGGFQVFSLGFGMEHGTGKIGGFFPDDGLVKERKTENWAKVTEKGVMFRNPVTGDKAMLTPEVSIRIQERLGADIILAFDECTSPLHDHAYTEEALGRTHRWAERCLKTRRRKDQTLFGIVQGGAYKDLRQESAKVIDQMDFPGHAIGGSLGKSKQDMHHILDWTVPLLDAKKPIHLLGVGAVEDIFNSVERGIDTFDCVTPTRLARRGFVFLTPKAGGSQENKYRTNIKLAANKLDKGPIDKHCACMTCKNYSRAYLRHLFILNELAYYRLASYHNLHFFLRLMEKIRASIRNGTFKRLKKEWLG